MTTWSLALRLLFGVACAWPLWCLPGAFTRRQRLLRGLLATGVALVAAAVQPDRVFFERVDARVLSAALCGA